VKDEKGSQRRLDTTIEGATVEAHGVIVTPVARVRGTADAQRNASGEWRYAWAAIQPTKAIVRDRSGRRSEVRLGPTEGQVLGAMAAVGAVVALVMIMISLIARKR
jgi:predicted carbohydrate-binding protein with CBM5 and CBM33 domain